MIGYIGQDRCGERSLRDLERRGIDTSAVQTLLGETSQVLLFVEPSGERTIVGAVEDNLNRITIPTDAVGAGDLVYFAAWRAEFEPALRDLHGAGAVIASVPFLQPHGALPVPYVIGSMSEVADRADDLWARYSPWTGGELRCMALTLGADGVRVLGPGSCEELPAPAVAAADATGAGDAFAAAVLAAILDGRPVLAGVREGLAWGAATVRTEGSIPPDWREVAASG